MGPSCRSLRVGGCTEWQVDFLHEMVLDFGSEVDESDEVFANFGGRDGFGDADGSLKLLEGRG